MALVDTSAPPDIARFIDHNGQHDGVHRPHSTRRNVARVLWELIDNGPAKSPKTGNATGMLRDRLRDRGVIESGRNGDFLAMSGFSGTMLAMQTAGLIHRQLNAKRVYRIEALITAEDMSRAGFPRSYCGMERHRRTVEPEPIEPVPPLTVVPSPAAVEEEWPTMEPELDTLLGELAVTTDGLRPVALLMEATRLIALAVCEMPAGRAAVDTEVAERLAATLEDNQRLRRKLSLVGDELAATKSEREGLRRAKHMLETNIANMAKGAFSPEDYRRFIELDRTMRTPPGPVDKG